MAMPFEASLHRQRITPVNDRFEASRVSGDPSMTQEGKIACIRTIHFLFQRI
jgi:hypothetical protein